MFKDGRPPSPDAHPPLIFTNEILRNPVRIIDSLIDNRGKNGWLPTPAEKENLTHLSAFMAMAGIDPRGSIDKQEQPDPRPVQLGFAKVSDVLKVSPINVPYYKDNPLLIQYRKKGDSIWEKDAVAMVCAFNCLNTDSYGRNGVYRGIFIMPFKDGIGVINGIVNDPRLLFSLVRFANGHPVTRNDGNPVQIQTGDCVRILPNHMVGGHLNEPIDTRPFPSGYNPNPAI